MQSYIYELEAEVVRQHRRRMWPVWIFAFLVFVFCGGAWIKATFPQRAETFVLEAR